MCMGVSQRIVKNLAGHPCLGDYTHTDNLEGRKQVQEAFVGNPELHQCWNVIAPSPSDTNWGEAFRQFPRRALVAFPKSVLTEGRDWRAKGRGRQWRGRRVGRC